MSILRKLLSPLAALIVMAIAIALTFGGWQHNWLGRELALLLGVLLMFVVGVSVIFGNHLRRW
jgi:hypothetical protein